MQIDCGTIMPQWDSIRSSIHTPSATTHMRTNMQTRCARPPVPYTPHPNARRFKESTRGFKDELAAQCNAR